MEPTTPALPFVEAVLHPTDFSPASEAAFAHALAIALLRQTKLWILHAGSEDDGPDWHSFPAVRATLARWGLLGADAPRAAVYNDLHVRVAKVATRDSDPVRATLDFLERHEPDLLVLATEGREGLPRWIRPSKAETLARRVGTRTLFVPEGARGFVSLATGTTSLRRILVPVDHAPRADDAIEVATRAATALGDRPVEITLLHVGEAGKAPRLARTAGEAWTFREATRQGDVVDEIAAEAEACGADLVVMATQGRHGVLDALRGSVTERVLRRAPCPLLAVPER
jgi:nucleotide-binding universal stress UspA family protein